jgi:hypothetical protein
MNWKAFGRSGHGLLSWHLPWGIEENHEKPQVSIARAPAEIWTEQLPNTNAEFLLCQPSRWRNTFLNISTSVSTHVRRNHFSLPVHVCLFMQILVRMFETRVLRRIFWTQEGGGNRGWRNLRHEKLHNLYSSPDITWMIKSRSSRACSTHGREIFRTEL